MPNTQLTLQIVTDDMSFSAWVHALPPTPWEDTPYLTRDANGGWLIHRNRGLMLRTVDERDATKQKVIARAKRRARTKRRKLNAGDFKADEATRYLRDRLGITQVPPVSDA